MLKKINILSLLLLLSISMEVNGKTLKDITGRTVIFPDNPQRVVSLAPSITEIIYALNQERRICGATIFSDYPKEALKHPRVGSYVKPNLERILALKPDCVIAIKDGNPKVTVKRLIDLGIPVFVTSPKDLTSVMEAVNKIGKLLNAENIAKKITTEMKRRIERVESVVKKAGVKPKVFFQIGIAPIVSIGNDSFIHELITKSGGINISAKFKGYPRFTKEDVIAFSPEVFIITSMARNEVFENVKRKWSMWKSMPAVKNNKMYIIDSNVLDRPTPRMVEGLEKLAEIIHPELF
ncbi:MAG: cobalamin-binding protein [Desulfobacterales bacterium]|nr:cobalamin-binding protein [Desulfobacterales bacterium]